MPGFFYAIFACYNMLMDKKLREYIDYIEKAAEEPSDELIKYHKTMTQQFQHERFIHLIVTMFFALFMIIFFFFFLVLAIYLPAGYASDFLMIGVGLILAILFVVTLFYVRHYYQLENGTQKLEELTKKLFKR